MSVGQLLMTGPLLVSFPQSSEDPSQDNADISMLVHWNPGIYSSKLYSKRVVIKEVLLHLEKVNFVSINL